jgi:hypothetical protein
MRINSGHTFQKYTSIFYKEDKASRGRRGEFSHRYYRYRMLKCVLCCVGLDSIILTEGSILSKHSRCVDATPHLIKLYHTVLIYSGAKNCFSHIQINFSLRWEEIVIHPEEGTNISPETLVSYQE